MRIDTDVSEEEGDQGEWKRREWIMDGRVRVSKVHDPYTRKFHSETHHFVQSIYPTKERIEGQQESFAQVKALAAKYDNYGSVLGTHMVREER